MPQRVCGKYPLRWALSPAPISRILIFLDLGEEKIVKILGYAGTVKFRLVTYRDTGKSKGFGYAEFQDANSAANAVRNLNDFEIDGRKILVDWSFNEKDSVPANYGQAAAPLADDFQLRARKSLHHLLLGIGLTPNLPCTNSNGRALPSQPLFPSSPCGGTRISLPPQEYESTLRKKRPARVEEAVKSTSPTKRVCYTISADYTGNETQVAMIRLAGLVRGPLPLMQSMVNVRIF